MAKYMYMYVCIYTVEWLHCPGWGIQVHLLQSCIQTLLMCMVICIHEIQLSKSNTDSLAHASSDWACTQMVKWFSCVGTALMKTAALRLKHQYCLFELKYTYTYHHYDSCCLFVVCLLFCSRCKMTSVQMFSTRLSSPMSLWVWRVSSSS